MDEIIEDTITPTGEPWILGYGLPLGAIGPSVPWEDVVESYLANGAAEWSASAWPEVSEHGADEQARPAAEAIRPAASRPADRPLPIPSRCCGRPWSVDQKSCRAILRKYSDPTTPLDAMIAR